MRQSSVAGGRRGGVQIAHICHVSLTRTYLWTRLGYACPPGTKTVRICRDEVRRITASGRRARYKDGNVRAAIHGIVDLAAPVHQVDMDHGTWSSRRGTPRAYPPIGAARSWR